MVYALVLMYQPRKAKDNLLFSYKFDSKFDSNALRSHGINMAIQYVLSKYVLRWHTKN